MGGNGAEHLVETTRLRVQFLHVPLLGSGDADHIVDEKRAAPRKTGQLDGAVAAVGLFDGRNAAQAFELGLDDVCVSRRSPVPG